MNNWNQRALDLLEKSRKPIPAELNEIDWKSALSDNTDKLTRHLSALSNLPGGGFMAFGVNNDGSLAPMTKADIDEVIKKLGNIARNNLTPPIGIEHAILEVEEAPVLFIHIPEQNNKPTYLRGGNVFDSYRRSGGATVKMSQQEVKSMLALSQGFSFEQQIALQNQKDNEVVSLLEYDSYFRLMNRNLPDNKSGILDALVNEGMLVKNNTGWNITNLGAILFASNLEFFKDLK